MQRINVDPLFFRSFQGWPPTGQKKKTLQLQALTMENTMKLDFRGYSWTNPRPQKSRPSYLLHIRAHWSHFRRTADDQGHSTKWPIFKPWRLHSEGLCQEKRARVGHCHWIPGSQSRQTVDASARRWRLHMWWVRFELKKHTMWCPTGPVPNWFLKPMKYRHCHKS